MSRKVAILTHPPLRNYGGILQAFALQEALAKLGFDVCVLDRRPDLAAWKHPLVALFRAMGLKRFPSDRKQTRLVRGFVRRNMRKSPAFFSHSSLVSFCRRRGFGAVVVGSDQVWRADYAEKFGDEYFLGFLPAGVRKVAYAASFGLDSWDYDDSWTSRIKSWLSSFSGISVREESGVALCREHLGISPEWIIDPTMLDTSVYERVTSSRLVPEKYAFVYWLGDSSRIEPEIERLKAQGYRIVRQDLRSDATLMPVEDWLSYIRYADCVLTDSFHGCVFSILFHRPFMVLENKSGGNSRLTSLFRQLGIPGDVFGSPASPDYAAVDGRLDSLRHSALGFLRSSL